LPKYGKPPKKNFEKAGKKEKFFGVSERKISQKKI